MSDWIFDTPWWLPTLIAIVGAVMFWNGNRHRNTRMTRGGIGVILAAVLLCVVSWVVDTPKEKAIAGSKKLIESFEKKDWPGFSSVLARDVTVTLLNSPEAIYADRDSLVAAAKDAQEKYKFESMHILSMSANQTQTIISVDLDLMSTQDLTMGRPITSAWRFEWQEAADGWALERIVAVEIARQPVGQVRPMFPRGK